MVAINRSLRVRKIGRGDDLRVQTSSYKMNKFWGYNVEDDDSASQHYILTKRVYGKLWLFRLMCTVDIFSKFNKISLSLLGKQLTVFIVNDKIQAFKQKLGF